MDFDAFIAAAWDDHGDRPHEVADRLCASLHRVERAGQVAPYARIVTHVFGEHLGQWQRGVEVLASLPNVAAGDPAAAGAIARGVATLRYAGGDRSAVAALAPEDRVTVLAAAASAFAGRCEFTPAIAAYDEALDGARAGLPPGSPALRALAVGGNNLAAALEEKADRDASETRGMVSAAEAALHYWRLAGTWLEEERALYRLARSRLEAGAPAAAADSARRCLDVCARHDAPALERFFGYAALALAYREAGDAHAHAAARRRALELAAQVPQNEQGWCAAELRALGA